MTADDPRPIKGWTVQATCPACAGVLTHVADGVPDANTSRAIAACTSCGRTFAVQITMTDVSSELGRKLIAHPLDCDCARCANARKTHCPNGHELAADNLYVTPRGTRECRTCRREHQRSRAA